MPVRVEPMMVTTSMELPGYRIVRNFGIVRGIIVRSRSLLGSIGAGLQTIIGGNITLLTELCENTREESFELMLQHAAEHGANAVINMRYDATEIMQGVTEVLAYGTAVTVERSAIRRARASACSAFLRFRKAQDTVCRAYNYNRRSNLTGQAEDYLPGRSVCRKSFCARRSASPWNLRAARRAWSIMEGSISTATRPTKGGSSCCFGSLVPLLGCRIFC